MRHQRLSLPHLLAAGILAFASAAALPRAACAAADRSLALSLTEPAEGVLLYGGDSALLRWEPVAGIGPEVEEWEAFLSFDGGRTFPLRITPHLDLERRAVLWRVPNRATDEARLLLRLGNERHEREMLLPQVFRIARGNDDVWTPRRLEPGEPVRDGAAGVVRWSEGDRQGRGWREVESTASGAGLADAELPRVRGGARDEVCDREAGSVVLPESNAVRDTLAPPSTPLQTTATPAVPGDILLLCQRRNE